MIPLDTLTFAYLMEIPKVQKKIFHNYQECTRTKNVKKMIFHQYQQSTRRQICSEIIDVFSTYSLIQYDLLMFKYFQNNNCAKIQRFHATSQILWKRSEIPICFLLEEFLQNTSKNRVRWVHIWEAVKVPESWDMENNIF